MPNPRLLSPLRGRARVVALAVPVVFLGAILGGCDYQLQIQPTPTPQTGAMSLGVHQIAGRQPLAQPTSNPDSQLQQFFDSALGSGTTQPSTSDAATATAQSAPQAPVASPALAMAAAPAAPAAPIGGGVAAYPRLAAAPAPPGSSQPVVQPASQAAPATSSAPAAGDATLASAQPAQSHPTVTDAVSNRATTLPSATTAAASATAAPRVDPTATRVPPAPPTRPPATAARPPAPVIAVATPKPPVTVTLHAGENDLTYTGATTTIDHALASIAGSYTTVYYQPVGSSEFLVYRPGIDAPNTVTTGSALRIMIKPGVAVNLTMYPPL